MTDFIAQIAATPEVQQRLGMYHIALYHRRSELQDQGFNDLIRAIITALPVGGRPMEASHDIIFAHKYDDSHVATVDGLTAYKAALLGEHKMSEERGWLIERSGKWWCPIYTAYECTNALDARLDKRNWTSDSYAALRFTRKHDADALIAYFGWGKTTFASEHVWIDRKDSK